MKHVGSTARPRFCILVTGFGAFPGARSNPTVEIVKRLQREAPRLGRLGIELRCAVLPVVYADIAETLSKLVARNKPDAVLHLGLARRRQKISVEMRAVNRAHPGHPDASGRRPSSQALAPGAPPHLCATYPGAQIVAVLGRLGLPAERSIDAGDYVCNATLFQSLALEIAPQIGFLHVPKPRRAQRPVVGGRGLRPKMDDLTLAVFAATIVMAKRSWRQARAAPKAPQKAGAPESL